MDGTFSIKFVIKTFFAQAPALYVSFLEGNIFTLKKLRQLYDYLGNVTLSNFKDQEKVFPVYHVMT